MVESPNTKTCPDCELDTDFNSHHLDRRRFLHATGGTALVAAAVPATLLSSTTRAAVDVKASPESLVKKLYESMNEKQRAGVCFDWDYVKTFKSGINKKGLLRTRVENNWQVSNQKINSDFYTTDQQEMIRTIFEGLYNPEWIPKIL